MTGCTCHHPPDAHRGRWPEGGWHCTYCAQCRRNAWAHGHAYRPNPLDHDFEPCPCTPNEQRASIIRHPCQRVLRGGD